MRSRPEIEVTIATLGAQGDGVAETPQGSVYVPQAVPGDRLIIALDNRRGEILRRLDDGPGRVEPPCPHFGACGGCTVQHLDDPTYVRWKQDLVAVALRRRGLDPTVVGPLRRTATAGRRRVELAAHATAAGLRLGYFQRRSNRLLDLDDCLVMRPALRRLLAPLRSLMAAVLPPKSEARLLLTETRNGFDLLLTTSQDFSVDARMALAEFAAANRIARIAWRARPDAEPEPLAVLETPRIAFAGVAVALPAGAFLQASAEAEQIMVALARQAVAGAKTIADLFAGCGAFALPLAAQGGHVHAVDHAADAIASLKAAAGAAGLGGRLTGESRDLFRRPIQARQLAGYDAVLFDPPRAGAAAQVAQIAAAAVPLVLAISCNPASFASDAQTLVQAGYRLEWVVPIDQFVYSHHVELVALFQR